MILVLKLRPHELHDVARLIYKLYRSSTAEPSNPAHFDDRHEASGTMPQLLPPPNNLISGFYLLLRLRARSFGCVVDNSISFSVYCDQR
jgi:hypothetical protein